MEEDLNKIKTLAEQISIEMFYLMNNYTFNDVGFYHLMSNARRTNEHLFGVISITQNMNNIPNVITNLEPNDGGTNPIPNEELINTMNSDQFINQDFTRQRSASSQSYINSKWENIEPGATNSLVMSVPASTVNSRSCSPVNIKPSTAIKKSENEPMSLDELSTTQETKSAFADVVKSSAKSTVKTSVPQQTKIQDQQKNEIKKENQNEKKVNLQNRPIKKRDNQNGIRPFIKQDEEAIWRLEYKYGMVLDYIHEQEKLNLEIANVSDLMNIKFYFRDPEVVGYDGLWAYNKRYYIADDGYIYILNKNRELVRAKKNDKEVQYTLARIPTLTC